MSEKQDYYVRGYDPYVSKTHLWRTAKNCLEYMLHLLKTDYKVLDVGCGPGTITCDLANSVPNGRVIGLDTIDEVLQEAEDHRKRLGVTNVEFVNGSVYNLPYPDDSFDLVHAHQVLLHLKDDVEAVKEIHRVLKPGGYMCLKEIDLAATVVYPYEYRETFLSYILSQRKNRKTTIDLGRRLKALLLEIGLNESQIDFSTSTWTASSTESKNSFLSIFLERIQNSKEEYEVENTDNDTFKSEVRQCLNDMISDERTAVVFLHGQIVYKKD